MVLVDKKKSFRKKEVIQASYTFNRQVVSLKIYSKFGASYWSPSAKLRATQNNYLSFNVVSTKVSDVHVQSN